MTVVQCDRHHQQLEQNGGLDLPPSKKFKKDLEGLLACIQYSTFLKCCKMGTIIVHHVDCFRFIRLPIKKVDGRRASVEIVNENFRWNGPK